MAPGRFHGLLPPRRAVFVSPFPAEGDFKRDPSLSPGETLKQTILSPRREVKTDYSPPGETFKTVAFLPRRGGQKPLHSSPGAGRIKSCIPPLEGGEENPHLPLGGERQKAVDRSLRSLALPRRGISFFLLLPARQANEVSDLQLFYTSLRGRDSEFFPFSHQGRGMSIFNPPPGEE